MLFFSMLTNKLQRRKIVLDLAKWLTVSYADVKCAILSSANDNFVGHFICL